MAKSKLLRAIKKSLQIQIHAQRQGLTADQLLERIEEKKAITRRSFLGTTVAAAGLLALTTTPAARLAWGASRKPASDTPDGPVVILGAGFAGLTAAYRLHQANIPFVIYESAHRFGGRVFTKDKFNKEGMFCELGAELVDNAHEDLIALAQELGVELEDFTESDAAFEKGVYEYQGTFYTEHDLIRDAKPLGKAILRDLAEAFPGGERQPLSYKSQFNARKFDLIPLNQYLASITELPKWVRDTIEYAFVGEYGLEAGKQSALNLLLLIGTDFDDKLDLFGEGAETKRIKGGNSRLAEAMAKKLGISSGKDSARIRFSHTLVGWKEKSGHHQLSFRTAGGTKEVKAGQIVCTIPFTRLREVQGISRLGFSERKLRSIMSLPYGTNAKLMIGFSGRPWRNPLPGTKLPASNGSLFSPRFQSLWEASRLQKGKSGILTNYVGGEMGLRTSMRDVQPIVEGVERFYAGARAQFDSNTALMNWNRSPHHKGSFACPGPGHYTELFGAISEDELGGRVVFAGEHTSQEYQAYMNGAIETGNAAAARVVASRNKVKSA